VCFAGITVYVASQRVFIFVSVYFGIDLVQKILDVPSCVTLSLNGNLPSLSAAFHTKYKVPPK
jgi:hypothetical protein